MNISVIGLNELRHLSIDFLIGLAVIDKTTLILTA